MTPIQGNNAALTKGLMASPRYAAGVSSKAASVKNAMSAAKPMSGGKASALARAAATRTSATQAAPQAPSLANASALRARAAMAAATKPAAAKPAVANPATPPMNTSPPTTMMGDIDGDGSVGRADAKALMNYLFTGGPMPQGMGNADMDGNGEVNLADAVQLLNTIREQEQQQAPPTPSQPIHGDVDGDGVVNENDGHALAKHLFGGGEPPAGLEHADMDKNGRVDLADVVQIYRRSSKQ